MSNSSLFSIIAQNNFKALKKLLVRSINLNIKDVAGFTPLMMAAARGRSDFVQLLLTHGADANMLDNTTGITALHLACQQGDSDAVSALLSAGAFINLQAQCNGVTPLINAVWYRKPDVVALLLEQTNINPHLKTHFGATAYDMLENNPSSSYQKPLSAKEQNDEKKMRAAFVRFEEKVQSAPLVAALATQGKDFEEHQQYLTKYFRDERHINAEAPLSCSGYDSYTPLHIAARDGLLKICQTLLDAGADVGARDAAMQSTPVHKAAYKGHAHVLELLSSHPNFHAVVNCQTAFNGYTALHAAVWQGNIAAAKVLLRHGANATLKGHDGCTALDLARDYDYFEIEELLEPVMEAS
jgi:ankyrin repeat protein